MKKAKKRAGTCFLLWISMIAACILSACGGQTVQQTQEPQTAVTTVDAKAGAQGQEEPEQAQAAETAAALEVAALKTEGDAETAGTAEAPEPGSTASTAEGAAPESAAAVDYSLPENWAYFAEGEDRDVDLFLVCPTVDVADEYNMSLDDEETKTSFVGALNMERGIYEDSTRMYAPFYRQAAMKVYGLENREDWEQYLGFAYRDVSAAFSWYLENENRGRPIILAGFSQGADMCYRLLEEYFSDADLNDRLVAVYAIGWACTEEMAAAYPQIRPAQAADDYGVVVSFDCEAPEVEETFINPAGQKAHSINPLNWAIDGTPADKSLNLGACFTTYGAEIRQEVPELCGCYIDESRGVLKVTDIDDADYPPIVPGLPEGGYHVFDYQFFFRNLQQNVQVRIESYRNAREADQAA